VKYKTSLRTAGALFGALVVGVALLYAPVANAYDLTGRVGNDSRAFGVTVERDLPYVGHSDLGIEFTDVRGSQSVQATLGKRFRVLPRVSVGGSIGAGWGHGFAYSAGVGADYALTNGISVGVDHRLYRDDGRHNDQGGVTEVGMRLHFN